MTVFAYATVALVSSGRSPVALMPAYVPLPSETVAAVGARVAGL